MKNRDMFMPGDRVGFYTDTEPNMRMGIIDQVDLKFKDYWEYKIVDELNNKTYKVIYRWTSENPRNKLYRIENSVHFISG